MVLLNLLQLVADMVAAEIVLPCEVHTSRTSHKVGLKFVQSCPEACTKLAKVHSMLAQTLCKVD